MAEEEVSRRRFLDREEEAAGSSLGGAVDVCGAAVATGECGDGPSFSSSKAERVVGEAKCPLLLCPHCQRGAPDICLRCGSLGEVWLAWIAR